MPVLPHRISTLIYAFNTQDELLMLQRGGPPNAGLWSPFGGKVHEDKGESPYQGAARETAEEVGLTFQPKDFHLTGMVSECAYENQIHWLMFMFELKPRLEKLPLPHQEGIFEFVPISQVAQRPIPQTDHDVLWPLFLKYRRGFFSVSIVCHPQNPLSWKIEEVFQNVV